MRRIALACLAALLFASAVLGLARTGPAARAASGSGRTAAAASGTSHYLYTVTEGSIDFFDIDNNFAQVGTISLPQTAGHGIRGVAADPAGHILYVAYGGDGASAGDPQGASGSLLAYDLVNQKVLWTQRYSHGVDSMAITPDGKTIYMPDGELTTGNGDWYVINAATGAETGAVIHTGSGTGDNGPHNTVVSLDGSEVFMGDRNTASGSNYLYVASTATSQITQKVGPFHSGIRPFTVNKANTLVYTSVTGYKGFQTGDLSTGKVLYSSPITTPSGTSCPNSGASDPSHGVSLSPDEKQLYVIDWPCNGVAVFDVSGVPTSAPKQVAWIPVHQFDSNQSPCTYDCLGDGWLLHSSNGRYVFVGDSGDVIDTSTNTVVAHLNQLYNTRVFIELDWSGGVPNFTTTRSGLGRGSASDPPPANSTAPAITGTPQQGHTLSTSNGTWTNSPTSYSYQWQDCTTTACTNIAGATRSSYALQGSDVGSSIDVVVTATDAGGSGQATSAHTATVTAAPTPPPSNSSLPVISGTPQQAHTLSTTNGAWSNSPTAYRYAWEDCNSSGASCTAISGATSSTHALQASDVGQTIRAVVTASNAAGSAPATSAQTAPVTAASASSTGISFVQGNANIVARAPLSLVYPASVAAGDLLVGVFRTPSGSTPSVSDNLNGAWTKAPVSNSYLSIFYLAGAKAGATTVTVSDGSASGAVRGSVAEYSGVAPSSPFDSGACNTNQANPSTTGSTAAIASGELVFAGVGSSSSGVTVAAGSSDGAAATVRGQISGSNGTIAAEDVVHSAAGVQDASFTLNGSVSDYGDDCVATFKPQATAPPTNTSPPTITGTPQQGNALTATPGTWSNSPTTYTYQWQDDGTTKIAGATSPTYVAQASDVGHTLNVVVTATNSRGSASASSAATAKVTSAPPPPPPGSGIHVSGNQLLAGNGTVVHLHGVDRSGTEYACAQGWGIFDGSNVTNDDSQPPLMKSWGINSEFVGLNEDCWLGINGIPAAYSGANYRAAIEHYVQTIEANGMYPVIGFFWGAPGTTKALSQPTMPDNDHTPAFWQSVANAFKGDPNVIFRLQEEPHPNGGGTSLSDWKCWSQGDVQYNTANTLVPGSQVSHCSEGYPTVGMQSLINIIRGTGAKNVIQVPGLQWANAMSCSTTTSPVSCGFLDSTDGVRVTDPLSSPQLMGDVDVYPNGNACGSVTCYNATYLPVAQTMPFAAGEFGESVGGNDCTTTQADALMNWSDQNGSGYDAWDWDTWGGCNQLITNYSGGAPNGAWGSDFKNHLATVG